MRNRDNVETFFALLRAGLWEKEVRLSQFEGIDFNEIYQLAEFQAVVGVVAAGLEQAVDIKVPKVILLTYIGNSLQLEQRNIAMNQFVAGLIKRMKECGVEALLIKGQGIAQNYKRPLWRSCGDVDLFLSEENYNKAKSLLLPLASEVEPEEKYKKHIALTIDDWVVELHGNLKSSLSRRIEGVLDYIYQDTFFNRNVSVWNNNGVEVPILEKNNEVLYVFTHILQHYFHGGIGLRQVCDWCRLLWKAKDDINVAQLEERLKNMGLISEWKSFAAFAVNDLGIPVETMPLYDHTEKWRHKALRIKELITKSGNFGHRDLRYVKELSYLGRKLRSLKNTLSESLMHFKTFPFNSIKFLFYYMGIRIIAFTRGE
jgi:hypothetical protein